MKLKAVLKKPCSLEERKDFILNNIRKTGYVYKETDEEHEAWDYTSSEKQEQEQERIKRLSCTKRDFALILQELGITYQQLKTLIASSEQAQLEWELCERLYRFNPLLDVMGAELGITPLQLDNLFKYANGEITIEKFRGM